MSYDTIESQVDELASYASNFSEPHYNGCGLYLSKRWVKGRWDRNAMLNYIKVHLVNAAADDYKRCHGSMTQTSKDIWPNSIRWAAAIRIYDHFVSEFQLGNFYCKKPV